MVKREPIIISIEKIDEGIKQSIYNSLELLVACESIFYDKVKYDGGITEPKTQNYVVYSMVLYYYAMEEFGKAIKLKESKQEAEKNNIQNINVTSWFMNHQKKIERIHEIYGNDLHILKSKELTLEPIDLKNFKFPQDKQLFFNQLSENIKFEPIEYEDAIFTNYQGDRSNLFLTNYDQDKKTWRTLLPFFTSHEVEMKIPTLRKTIHKWQTDNIPS